jgi:indole-3-glycerol phosphate synthase
MRYWSSGISSRLDVEKLKGWGVNAILVGEALVTTADIKAKIRELML